MTPDDLHQRLREQRDLFNEAHSTRLHRAISWWRAAKEQDGNADLQFITAWIALSACSVTDESQAGEDGLLRLIERLVALDKEQAIYNMLWHQYSGPVKALLKNQFVYGPFWDAQRLNSGGREYREGKEHRQGSVSDWKVRFERSSVEALNCLSRKKVPELLAITLERLGVLKAQVIGGGATFNSRVNREQVETGAGLLMTLLPVVLNIMLEHPHDDWGELAFPVVTDQIL
mgnify:CR=1 FL=1